MIRNQRTTINERRTTRVSSVANPVVVPSVVSSCLRGKTLEVRSEKLEESGSAALHNSSNSSLLSPNFSPSASQLLIAHYSLFIERRHRRAAFTLIEIMFAIAILGIGLIMIAATFPIAIKWTTQDAQQTVGQVIAQNAISEIKTGLTGQNMAPILAKITPLDGFYLIASDYYSYGNAQPYPGNAVTASYYWVAYIRPDPAVSLSASVNNTSYNVYIFVFNRSDLNNRYYGSSVVPTIESDTWSSLNSATLPPKGEFPIGSIGVDANTGEVFHKIVNASGSITTTGILPLATDPILYAPPATGTVNNSAAPQTSSPLLYVYVTTLNL